MKPGELVDVTAHTITLDGAGVGALDGCELRVPGLFPGERAQVRVQARSRHHPRAHGQLHQLLHRHPARRQAPCPQHIARGGRCTGCALAELSEPAQREAKRALLAQRYGLHVARIEPAPEAWGYRLSAKRVAFTREGRLALGSYRRGSHRPADMEGCLIDHPKIAAAFSELVAAANALGLKAYDERRDTGELRYAWAKTDGRDVLVTLVVSHAAQPALRALPPRLPSAAGVSISVQDRRSNHARGSDARLLWGKAALEVPVLHAQVEVGALGFLQPNPAVAALAYAALLDCPAPEDRRALAFDLYAGAGLTTGMLRRQFHAVLAAESHPESARRLGVAPEAVEAFLAAQLRAGARPDLVVANPPRKGLGPEVCAQLGQLAPPQIRIMSCGPEGLARDLKQLTAAGYALEALHAFDTLPQTPHLELVAKLTRRAGENVLP